MNPRHFSTLFFLVAVTLVGASTLRAEDKPAAKSDREPPVNVCIVSGEHLQPGEIITYVYKESGQPDRILRFCCHKCLARFKADPARYLKKLDQLQHNKTNDPAR